jgi:MFS family permease
MFTGLFGGTAICTILLSYVAHTINFQMVFIISGFIVILTIILPLMIKEIKAYKKRPKIGNLLVLEFKKKNTILIALLGLVAATNFGIIVLILPEYMMNFLNLNVMQTGSLTTVSTIGITLGAITGGIIADKWTRKNTLYIFLIGTLFFTALLTTANTWQILVIIYPLFGFFQGGATYAAMMAMFMDITNPKIGATQYSILTSLSNFGEIGIGLFSGTLVLILGYHRLFLYTAWLIGPSILLLYLIKETKK